MIYAQFLYLQIIYLSLCWTLPTRSWFKLGLLQVRHLQSAIGMDCSEVYLERKMLFPKLHPQNDSSKSNMYSSCFCTCAWGGYFFFQLFHYALAFQASYTELKFHNFVNITKSPMSWPPSSYLHNTLLHE